MEWVKVKDYLDIIYEKKEGIARISFNRPEVLNACRGVTFDELIGALEDASRDPTVGVIVIASIGDKAFCVGGDQREPRGDIHAYTGRWYVPTELPRVIANAPKPVIAVVKGYAIGGGHWLHVICDLTIAAENAVFGQVGPRVGSAAQGFIVAILARVIGEKKAREMWYLCRRYNAQEALQMGLVNIVVPLEKLDEEVEKVCQEILANSPTCIKGIKQSFESALEPLRQPSLPIDYEAFYCTEESMEGQRAFQEKRRPDFSKYRK